MRRAFVSLAVLVVVAVLAFGCAPDQPSSADTCENLSQCELGKVCDRTTSRCVAEPEDRFIGAFECILKPQRDAPLQLSQVVGRVGGVRYPLSLALCVLDDTTDSFTVSFSIVGLGYRFTMFLAASAARTGRVEVKPAFDAGDLSAFMQNDSLGQLYGTAAGGFLEITNGKIEQGETFQAYVDVPMVAATPGKPRFGKPCPRGIAECGSVTPSAGGASFCSEIRTDEPIHVCTSACKGSGDCSVGDGVCIEGYCTTACTGDADCTSPARCLQGTQGGGCF